MGNFIDDITIISQPDRMDSNSSTKDTSFSIRNNKIDLSSFINDKTINDVEEGFETQYDQILERNRHKGFLLNETWNKILNFQARVISINEYHVVCECIIDKEAFIFENRSFSKILFDHLDNLSTDSFVFITLKEKKGSSRIDVSDGNKLVDKNLFDTKKLLDEMDDFNDPLNGPILL
ncbi:hypothetical protein [Fluviicola taffensis]|uniref:Uncharacterized protein n=1 Tax=Fluviicola taffensis (strain DSM 16823 / NCIMB 13979 / RW262) TaxID=755732 RepID=F2IHJ6_FLUTR|nr:hypothetical protein [Fluviicola taffensis]AEA43761.1 hypothetical protein Fluta_1770 [Fluviicola taffensis DSM 16823]